MKESRIVNEFIWDGNKIIMPSWFPNRVRVDYVKVEKSELSKTDYKQLILTTQKYHGFVLDGQKKQEKVTYVLNPEERFVEDSDGNYYIV